MEAENFEQFGVLVLLLFQQFFTFTPKIFWSLPFCPCWKAITQDGKRINHVSIYCHSVQNNCLTIFI